MIPGISSGKVEKAQRVVIYGTEGIGKSTFASQFPSTIFIDVEEGTNDLDVTRTPTPTSYSMLKDMIARIKTARPMTFRTLVIDTADWTERLISKDICDKFQIDGIEGLGWGKGYTYLEEEFGRFLNSLQEFIDLGINVVICAHAKINKFEQPDELGAYDRWELKLQKKTAPLLKEWADMILFANYETHVVNVDNQGAVKGKNKAQGGRRVMYTTHTPSWDAKNRKGLADKLDFDYKEIAHIFEKDYRVASIMAPKESKKEDPVANKPNADKAALKPIEETKEEIRQDPVRLVSNRELNDLMVANNVTIEQIQNVVSSRGYYPAGTPIENYDEGFVQGVLVGAWEQVYTMIKGGM
ncbi:ATP-binding protein [Peptostreptococcus stomatis]